MRGGLVFLCFFVTLSWAIIESPDECTSTAASVTVPGENSILFVITEQQPVLCFNLLSSDELDDSVLLLDFEVLDDEYVLQQNAEVEVHINYNCTKTVCESYSSSDSQLCKDLSSYISSANTLVPISVVLVSESTGDLFTPIESVSVQLNLRWDTDPCSDDSNNAFIWFIVLGIVVAIGLPVLMIIAVVVFLKMKKPTPPDQDYVIQSSVSDNYY